MTLNEKPLGYLLLTIGIIIIILAALNVYQVFTKQMQPIDLFSFPGISLDLAGAVGGETGAALLPGSLKTEIIPAQMLNLTSNIAAHFFLMGFVVSVGYRIASLGVSLVRTIEVKVRGKESEVKG